MFKKLTLILLICVIGRCKADINTDLAIRIAVPTVVFLVSLMVLCTCLWTCHYYVTRQQVYHFLPSTVTSDGQKPKPYQLSTSPAPWTTKTNGKISQTNLPAFKSTSFAEATLHQGDAPPAYMEAVNMTSVTYQ